MQPFGHNTWAENWGLMWPLFWGKGAGSPSNTLSPGPRPISAPSGNFIHPAVWSQRTRAENWGLFPFWERGIGSPSSTMWPGLRPTSVPSFILMHPTVWPQYTNVTDRTNRQDRRAGQIGQPSDSIGRTVLQTVAQKLTTGLNLRNVLYAICAPLEGSAIRYVLPVL